MRVLVAGIGNVLRADDGFGVEVVRRLAAQPGLPAGVELADVGIRGLHLAYRLLEGYHALVLVDATCRGGPPGSLYTLEHDLGAPPPPAPGPAGEGAAGGRPDGAGMDGRADGGCVDGGCVGGGVGDGGVDGAAVGGGGAGGTGISGLGSGAGAPALDGHGMDPAAVLGQLDGLAAAMGLDRPVGRVLVLGCEPADLGDRIGLSAPVAAAVGPAAAAVRRLLDGLLAPPIGDLAVAEGDRR